MTDTWTPARRRAERFAKLAPEGAQVEITDNNSSQYLHISQVFIRGSIDCVCITIGNRPGTTRTRVTAKSWFNSGSQPRPIRVRDLPYRVRELFIRPDGAEHLAWEPNRRGELTMSLIEGRINDLIWAAKEHVNLDKAAEIARILRCTGRYGSEAPDVVRDVLAAIRVLAGPDAENARYLSRGAQ